MTIEEFKTILIRDGIEEVTEEYSDEADHHKRDGAIDGFEIAGSLETREQFEHVLEQREKREREIRNQHMAGNYEVPIEEYWTERWATMQVEWVLNVLIAAAWAGPNDIISSRAALKAEQILTRT